MIRLTVPSIDDAEVRAVREVLESGLLVQGPKVAAFERAVADSVGAAHGVAVSNCTAALHLALLALGVRPGDQVVTTTYSWPATSNVIELCGAEPVFVDICPDTFCMDPEELAKTLARLMDRPAAARRVKAILPVHAFGQIADMPAIAEIARRYDVPVVEDAACALGARLHERPAGSWGVMACFSFHPRKAITTGEGGMITTNDAALARTLRALRNHGQDSDAAGPDFILPGFNYRMTDLQGALGLAQMAKLSEVLSSRRRGAALYDQLLAETPLTPPYVAAGAEPVYQSYVGLLPEDAAPARAELIARLRAEGIETTVGTWHIPLTTFYRKRYGYQAGDYPAADRVFAGALTLPLHAYLTPSEQQLIVQSLLAGLDFFSRNRHALAGAAR
jgi:dTDP-4-amino-4,6-dideoxygalactose transaminase